MRHACRGKDINKIRVTDVENHMKTTLTLCKLSPFEMKIVVNKNFPTWQTKINPQKMFSCSFPFSFSLVWVLNV